MIYIEQPIGTGFSFVVGNNTGNVLVPNSTEDAMDSVINFLYEFFNIYE